MSKQAFYNGILYTIEYQPQLYYEFSYNEELGVYVYLILGEVLCLYKEEHQDEQYKKD